MVSEAVGKAHGGLVIVNVQAVNTQALVEACAAIVLDEVFSAQRDARSDESLEARAIDEGIFPIAIRIGVFAVVHRQLEPGVLPPERA